MAARRPATAPSAPTASTSFLDLGLPAELTRVLARHGVTTPFPIQAATLPDTLAGRDVLGRGRTGSGKTYAFVLPVLARLAASATRRQAGRPRALVLAPTRELATQIEAAIAPLARALSLRTLTVFGGVGAGPQIAGLRAGVDIVVACPGRLADHVEAGHARLDAVEITVLDEADHMADLGFLPVVRRLLDQTPRTGQRLLFSATLDRAVDVLVRRFLTDPVTHSVDPPAAPVTDMIHHVLHVSHDHRLPVLVDLAAAPGRTLVFTRTKHRARALTRKLVAAGVPAVELHGNLGQPARTRNLRAFSDGSATTMVATDIAARGIHVDDVTVVIHADPPVEHKAYLHRSGRTARAGADGTVVTLATDDQLGEVRLLTKKAGIAPTTTRLAPGHPLLAELAPGQRRRVAVPPDPTGAAGREAGADRGKAGGNGKPGNRAKPAARGAGKPADRGQVGDRGQPANRRNSTRQAKSTQRGGVSNRAQPGENGSSPARAGQARGSSGAAGFSARARAARR